jgi:hypothetical protein
LASIRVIVAYEIIRFKKSLLRQHFTSLDALSGLPETVSRLIGRTVGQPGVTRGIFQLSSADLFELLSLDYISIVDANDVIVISFEFETKSSDDFGSLLKREVSARYESLGRHLPIAYANQNLVYPVQAVLFIDSKTLDFEVNSDWLQDFGTKDNTEFKSELIKQLVARVGIERSLANWASVKGNTPWYLRPIWVPYISHRLGRLKVTLLPDRSDITEKYSKLRSVFNLDPVRKEIVDAGRNWWTVAAVVISVVAIIFSAFLNK